MFKSDQQLIINLIKGLSKTNSPKLKFELLADFCLNCPKELTEFNDEVKTKLFNQVKTIKDNASARGKAFANVKNTAITHKIYKHPAFFENLPDIYCATCGIGLKNNPGFNWKKEKSEWIAYCPIPECFPQEQASSMRANYKYNLWKKFGIDEKEK